MEPSGFHGEDLGCILQVRDAISYEGWLTQAIIHEVLEKLMTP